MYLLPEETFAEAMAAYTRHGLTAAHTELPADPAVLVAEGGGSDPDACHFEVDEDPDEDTDGPEDGDEEGRRTAGSWRATWLADVLRAEGLVVVEVAGWKTRGYAYPVSPQAAGVSLFHHTGSSSGSGVAGGLHVVTYGREGLDGPIANWLTARNGVIYVVAAGVANNAGRGNARTAGLPRSATNSKTFGNEMENNGIHEKYTPVQYTAAIKSHAAVHRHLGWGASRAIGHKEWSTSGKPDPLLDMNQIRRDLAVVIARRTPPAPDKEFDDMDQKTFTAMLAAALRDQVVARLIGDAVKAVPFGMDAAGKGGETIPGALLQLLRRTAPRLTTDELVELLQLSAPDLEPAQLQELLQSARDATTGPDGAEPQR